ncbi:MAG TPA: CocE/NonD family hydrolase [Dehalococcoidales bacterium]|nr:CocE/NonD family hydrolase [Dehalococcoidales bacterium]
MSEYKFDYIFKAPLPMEGSTYPGFNPRTEKAKGMVIDYDYSVKMRDGVKIYIDVFRPDKEGQFPVLLCWGPYGKQGRPTIFGAMGNCGIDDEDINKYTGFEAGDPVYWCRNGFIIINADSRGAWGSEGDLTFMSPQEAEDCYDLIEWAGTQGWSNGKVGMMGVSYLAWTQWKAAALNPPHLAAINPWEGVSDFYRELSYHGGIPETNFRVTWMTSIGFGKNRVEDFIANGNAHPLFDDYWKSKNADLTKITVPAFVVASWTDHGLHNRGTLEGFKQIASKDKWLLVHGRKKWWHFYKKESVEMQRQFFNRFLKGIDNAVKKWPRVNIEIREKYYVGETRTENEWPLARTRYTKLFLNAANSEITRNSPRKEAHVSYSANDITDKTQNVKFEYLFDDKTEITGHMKLKLWVQADGADDMDLFIALEKIDRAGYIVPFPFFGNHDDGPVALGWLRVSHRELDEAKSTPYQPVHLHQRELKLKPGEIVPVEIEIWPSCTLFERGEKLRVTVQGSDIYWYPYERHTNGHTLTVNKGSHVIYTGGKYDSHLLAPVIPTER